MVNFPLYPLLHLRPDSPGRALLLCCAAGTIGQRSGDRHGAHRAVSAFRRCGGVTAPSANFLNMGLVGRDRRLRFDKQNGANHIHTFYRIPDGISDWPPPHETRGRGRSARGEPSRDMAGAGVIASCADDCPSLDGVPREPGGPSQGIAFLAAPDSSRGIMDVRGHDDQRDDGRGVSTPIPPHNRQGDCSCRIASRPKHCGLSSFESGELTTRMSLVERAVPSNSARAILVAPWDRTIRS